MYKVSSQDINPDMIFFFALQINQNRRQTPIRALFHPSVWHFQALTLDYRAQSSTVGYKSIWIKDSIAKCPSACGKSIRDQAQSMITSFYKALFKNRRRYDVLGRGLTLKSHRDNPSAISDQTAVHRALTLSISCRQACPGNRRHWNVAQD